jgi:hypothetical protein
VAGFCGSALQLGSEALHGPALAGGQIQHQIHRLVGLAGQMEGRIAEARLVARRLEVERHTGSGGSQLQGQGGFANLARPQQGHRWKAGQPRVQRGQGLAMDQPRFRGEAMAFTAGSCGALLPICKDAGRWLLSRAGIRR